MSSFSSVSIRGSNSLSQIQRILKHKIFFIPSHYLQTDSYQKIVAKNKKNVYHKKWLFGLYSIIRLNKEYFL
ncbi:Uncharacterized protein dnm_024450 [Desulfonema magnum]|uniref:Uncharacterized protein n=1 Tax=Desulfonema magnum TaxID=45655 RepID=A0A975BJF9_9BACT|nr:Uncharacterized protein dnm_024450 [Desulfonema magnum]